MTDQTPAAVTASYLSALGRGDVPGAMALLGPDVVWHQPGSNRFSGDYSGIDGVGSLLYWTMLRPRWHPSIIWWHTHGNALR